MDPVSLTASIIAILQVTGICLKYTNKFVGLSKHNSADLQTLLSTLYAFNGSVKNLQTHLEICEEDQARLAALSYIEKPLADCKDVLGLLEERLKSTSFVAKHVVGVRFDARLRRCLSCLEHSRALFNETLQGDQKTVLSAVERYVRNIAEDVQNIEAGVKDTSQRVLDLDKKSQHNHDEVIVLQRSLFESVHLAQQRIIDHNKGMRAEAKEEDGYRQRQVIIEWLSPLNFWSKHKDVLSRRQEGTGTWLLETAEFQDWLMGPTSTLWCHGIRMSIIVDYLQINVEAEDTAVTCVYFSYKDRQIQSCVNAMASILQQLVQKTFSIPESLGTLFENHMSSRTRPSLKEILHLLHLASQDYRRIFVVVDALDECGEDDLTRETFCREIRRIQPSVRLVITSRSATTVAHGFDDATLLTIYASKEDIGDYCASRIQKETRLAPYVTVDSELRDDIISTIVQNAQGMFLLAELHINSLAREHSKKRIRFALRNLPKELDGTYQEAWQRIQRQDSPSIDLAERVLSWIVHARRPLGIQELQAALAVEPGDKEFDEDAIVDEGFLISVCAGLVTVDRESNIIRFVHYTTQAYFDRVRDERFHTAQVDITTACLTYLSFNKFSNGYIDEQGTSKAGTKDRQFFSYAVQYWGHHARGDPERPCEALILSLLTKRSNVEYLFGMLHAFDSWHAPKETGTQSITISGIHYWGHHARGDPERPCEALILSLLTKRSNVEYVLGALHAYDSRHAPKETGTQSITISGILLAADFGLTRIVELLVAQGVDVNAKNDLYKTGTALHHAIRGGQETTVSTLLQLGADIYAEDLERTPALQHAIVHRQSAIAKLLIDHGVNVHRPDSRRTTALHEAAAFGDESTARQLLDLGADIDTTNSAKLTPLMFAAKYGHIALVRLCLEHGARIEAKDRDGRTALWAAARAGQEATALLLIEKGADIHVQDDAGESVLWQAARDGNEALTRHILDKGADVHSRRKDGDSALVAAIVWRRMAVAQLLVERGADIESRLPDGKTALMRAIECNPTSAAAKMIRWGADINATHSESTPLLLAISKGSILCTKLLLDRGVDLGTTPFGAVPLVEAARKGHLRLVQLLLENHAEVDAQNEGGETALLAARANGHSSVVDLLLEHGASANPAFEKKGPEDDSVDGEFNSHIIPLLDNTIS